MSFTQPHSYSSSPASLPRDYDILQHHSARLGQGRGGTGAVPGTSWAPSEANIIESDQESEEAHDEAQEEEEEVEEGEGESGRGSRDSMSDLGIPVIPEEALEDDEGQSRSRSRSPLRSRSPAHPRMGARGTAMETEVGERDARWSFASTASKSGMMSNIILGGTPIPPPSSLSTGRQLLQRRGELEEEAEGALSVAGSPRTDFSPLTATETTPLMPRTATYGTLSSMIGEDPSGEGQDLADAASRERPGFGGENPLPPAIEDVSEVRGVGEESEAGWKREVKLLCKYTVPIWGTHILEISLNVVSVFSLGHLGTTELAAASLASMTAAVTGWSILAGFISALDTLLPSAFTSSQPKTMGLWTQRMSVCISALLIPIALIWLNAESILLALRQQPRVAELAAQYLRIIVIGLPGYAGFEICRRYLQAQGLMHAPTIVLMVCSPLNIILQYLLVWGPPNIRLGFIGAPISSAVSMQAMFVLCFLQCYLAPRTGWCGWTTQAFSRKGLKPCLTLGIAGTLSMASEWWAWEIVGLCTSALGSTALAAQSVLLTSSSITYQLPYAISVSVAVRIGNLLGAGKAVEARVSSNVAILMGAFVGLINSTFFVVLRDRWGYAFSQDPNVIELVAVVLPIVAFFQIFDCLVGVTSGILRGTGRQAAGALINLSAYYIFGIPLGVALTFSALRLGLQGLWIGLTFALAYASAFSLIYIAKTNWAKEVDKVRSRMGIDIKPDVEAFSPTSSRQHTSHRSTSPPPLTPIVAISTP